MVLVTERAPSFNFPAYNHTEKQMDITSYTLPLCKDKLFLPEIRERGGKKKSKLL